MPTKLIAKGDDIKDPAWITIPWSLMHFWAGIQLAIILKYYNFSDKATIIISTLIHLIYEIKDYNYSYIQKSYKISDPLSNSLENCVGDSIVCLLGTILYLKLFKQRVTSRILIRSFIITMILFHYFTYYHGCGWNSIYKQFLSKVNLA